MAARTSHTIVETTVFGGFAVLSLVVAISKGFVPIFLAEAALWACVAAYFWRRKEPLGQAAKATIILSGLLVGGVQIYSIAQLSSSAHGSFNHIGTRYTYLQEGGTQFRVDSEAGRTDRLYKNGVWAPASFDRPAEVLPNGDAASVSMKDGGVMPKEICFIVTNNSNYIVRDISLVLTLNPPTPYGGTDKWSIILKPMGLLNVGGAEELMCAPRPIPFPDHKAWNYQVTEMNGWK